ncbi:MAG: hypothetical protein ABGY95_02500 [Rubritalea sp.]|uniref:hypothetical protein n=1 Tax=Rubritalea sp. TaxID=2109375 RepID=UPI003242CC1A
MKEFGGVFIASQGLRFTDGEEIPAAGEADAISWGQQTIANPNLVRRHEEDADLNEPEPTSFFAGGPVG